jgi:hypothetical protein
MSSSPRGCGLFLLTSAVLLGCAASLDAQEPNFWAFLTENRRVARCSESLSPHRQAIARLELLWERVAALKNPEPVGEVAQELYSLLKTECFLAAAETKRVPNPDSALALREWWTNGGGGDWLESFLELPSLGTLDKPIRHVVVPPDVRKTLNLEAHRDHPLSALLCPLTDAACGAETRGWRLRADAYFAAHRAAGRHDPSRRFPDDPPEPSPETAARECAEKTSDGPTGQRYQRWRACVEMNRPKQIALPLGDFKAPTNGWLVISGRRGHYEFCDTVRAYDLSTGAAFVDDSCSDLVLKDGGNVDFRETDKGRVRHVRAGTVSVENLREALWMLLLRTEATEIQLKAAYYPLPAGLAPQWTVRHDEGDLDITGIGMWASTGQTSLTWRWIPDTGAGFVGQLTWPDSYDAAENHAASLLDVAEEGFVEGCPSQAAGTMPLTSRHTHTLNSVNRDEITRLDQGFGDAVQRWRALPPCRSQR